MGRLVDLSEEAYALLTALKREEESYSDVVQRLAAERKDPLALKNLSPPRADFDLEELRGKAG